MYNFELYIGNFYVPCTFTGESSLTLQPKGNICVIMLHLFSFWVGQGLDDAVSQDIIRQRGEELQRIHHWPNEVVMLLNLVQDLQGVEKRVKYS